MTTTTSSHKPAWEAEAKWETRCYTTDELVRKGQIEESPEGELVEVPEDKVVTVLHRATELFVHVFRPGCARISFLVNHRDGRDITFTDPRGRDAGTAGTTGIWGTLPAPPVCKPRPLMPAGFRVELTRFVGAVRAEAMIELVRSEIFLP